MITEADLDRSNRMNRYFRERPTSKQAAGLLAGAIEEILYGGAGGGGKSSWLFMCALQYVDHPNYAALILRRTFRDLSLPGSLIDRSHEWLDGTDAKWNEQKHMWTFPTGAKIAFGHMEHARAEADYKSSEYQMIGFDELTEFQESQYLFMRSRLRRRAGVDIPLRIRGATNPGGTGHEWVKGRFITAEPTEDRMFIPATINDNPHLDREAYIRQLQQLPPVLREQILNGDWDYVTSGDIFRREWFRYYDPTFPEIRTDDHVIPIWNCQRFATVDLAASLKTTADYTVVGTWARDHSTPWNLYLLDVDRRRMEGPDIVPAIGAMESKWKLPVSWVESTGMQLAILQHAQRDGLKVREFKPDRDKVSRAMVATTLFEAGRILFPRGAPWLPDLEAELSLFPKGGHDDQVDVVSCAAAVAEMIPAGPPHPVGRRKDQDSEGGPPKWMMDNQRKADRDRRYGRITNRDRLQGLVPGQR